MRETRGMFWVLVGMFLAMFFTFSHLANAGEGKAGPGQPRPTLTPEYFQGEWKLSVKGQFLNNYGREGKFKGDMFVYFENPATCESGSKPYCYSNGWVYSDPDWQNWIGYFWTNFYAGQSDFSSYFYFWDGEEMKSENWYLNFFLLSSIRGTFQEILSKYYEKEEFWEVIETSSGIAQMERIKTE